MPSRIVREGIVSSPRVNSLSLGAEVLYRRLMSVADDYGRFFGSIMTIRVSCFPTNPERFREREIEKWLDELLRGEKPLVKTYSCSGLAYLELQDFHQQQRGKSKFPPPPWFISQQDREESAKQEISGPVNERESSAQPIRSRIRSRNRSEYSNTPLAPQGGAEPPDSLGGRKRPQAVWYREQFGFWYDDHYWNHKGRDVAERAYAKAINRLVDKDGMGYNQAKLFLVAMVKRDRERFEGTDEWDSRQRMLPATWLNKRRWTDEDSPVVNGIPPARATATDRRRAETLAGMKVIRGLEGRA